MRVLVTGAGGFIGRYIVKELLDNGYEVVALMRKKRKIEGAEILTGDIRDAERMKEVVKGVDAVFHNAAYASDYGKKRIFYEVNVEGTRNVAEACISNGVEKIVYTSSAGVYGFPNKNEWITEDSPKKPINIYQKTKLLGEKLLLEYKQLHVTIVRPPLVLGAGGKASFLLLSRAKNGELSYMGDGNNFVTIAHAADVAKCLRLALEKGKRGEAYNVVSFICRVRELFEEIARQLGVNKVEKHVPYYVAYIAAIFYEIFSKEPYLTRFRVKSFGTTRRISWEKAKKELGFQPAYDLKTTVEDMVKWYRAMKE